MQESQALWKPSGVGCLSKFMIVCIKAWAVFTGHYKNQVQMHYIQIDVLSRTFHSHSQNKKARERTTLFPKGGLSRGRGEEGKGKYYPSLK